MNISDKSIIEIENVLNEILNQFSPSIYDEPNKKKFNGAIKDSCGSDEDAKEILLTLVVNDVFLFVKEKEFLKVEANTKSCLSAIGCDSYTINKVLEILKVADSLKKLKRRKQIKKIRNWAIAIIIFAIPIALYIRDYKSYYRTPNEILVSAGEFNIGENTFYVDKFFISKTEVTEFDFGKSSSKTPITNVSWYDAIKYCNELSERTNLESVYIINEETKTVSADFSKNGYRLPTKAEWYRAAKGSLKSSNDKYSGARDSDINSMSDYCWYIDNSNDRINAVAQKKPNYYNLYDMSGNVAEWCWDYYWDWNEKQDDNNINNPVGPAEGTYRSICGGFYGNSEYYINLINSQAKHRPESGELYYGFRVVRSYVKMNKLGDNK